MKPKSAEEPKQDIQEFQADISAPYNHLYPPRNPVEDRLVTTLLLAGEVLAVQSKAQPETPKKRMHAKEKVPDPADFNLDFNWLTEITGRFQNRLTEDPRLVELLNHLVEVFRDEALLGILFRNLFPGPLSGPTLDHKGRSILTPGQIAVLREAGKDLSHTQIAANLDLSPRTVSTHLTQIYKKLGVSKPIQAVARAIVLGYLDMDALDFIRLAGGCNMRDIGAFNTFISSLAGGSPDSEALRPLAAFGLLLMVVSGTATKSLDYMANCPAPQRSMVFEVNLQGKVGRKFGLEHLQSAMGIVSIPNHAAVQGFRPGHLLVANETYSKQGLSSVEIVEFSPEGAFIRAFSGGAKLQSCLNGSHISLAFTSDGRLLVTSDAALMCFEDGGKTVSRLMEGCCYGVWIHPLGSIFVTLYSSLGCILKVLSPVGELLYTFGGTDPGRGYGHITGDSRGHVYVEQVYREHSLIEEFAPTGEKVNDNLLVSGCRYGYLVMDTKDNLYCACRQTGDIKIVTGNGTRVGSVLLPDVTIPTGIALNPTGGFWVCGTKPA